MTDTLRLTAENASPETLSAVAMETAGLLGVYKYGEYQALMALNLDDWDFEWSASSMDPTTGRVKLRPKTTQAMRLLDKARAQRVINRHTHLTMPTALDFIRATKRVPCGMQSRVQDFLLMHYQDSDILAVCKDFDIFTIWLNKRVGNRMRFNKQQSEALFHLLPKVYETLVVSPRQKHKA